MLEERSRPKPDDGLGGGHDAELVASIAGGDREALAALYDLHAPLLLGLAKRMLGNAEAAEDLVHDVFLEAWQHAAEYTADRGSVRAWLVVRTRSRALDRLGRRDLDARTMDRLSGEGAEAAVSLGVQALIDGARVRGLAAKLGEELRAVLDLAYFEGLAATEIAARLSIPVGTVKSRLARALGCLRQAMTPGEGGGT